MKFRLLSILLAVGLLAAAVPTMPAVAPGGKESCLPGDAFENDDVRIWFQGHKAHVHVTDKANDGTYQYKTSAIVEIDGDGADVRKMNIERAFPHDSTCDVEEDDEFVHLTITIQGSVRSTTGGEVGDATVEFRYTFNKTAMGAKFDLIVEDWPWAEGAAGHTLAYDFKVASGEFTLEPATNGIGIRNETDQIGYVDWAPNATVTYEDDSQAIANTSASWEGDDHELKVRLAFINADGGYVHLFLDPWMGVGNYVIVAGYLIGLAPVQQVLPPDFGRLLRAVV